MTTKTTASTAIPPTTTAAAGELPTTMRAISMTTYGAPSKVLSLEQLPVPQPQPHQVLIRVQAAATHAGDWHLIRGQPYFLRFLFGNTPSRPGTRVPGCELCGRVVALGTSVPPELGLRTGDVVFGDASESGFGAFAEFAAVDARHVARKPQGVSVAAAAAAGVSTLAALQALRAAGDVTGKRVLVFGASGGVGGFAVQLALSRGAHVSAVCSASKASFVRQLGAHAVFAYDGAGAGDGDTKRVDGVLGDVLDGSYDVVIDTAAFDSVGVRARALMRGGVYVIVGGDTGVFMRAMMFGKITAWRLGVRVVVLESKPSTEDLGEIAQLMEEGKVVAHVNKRFKLEQTAQAVDYVESRKVCGKVVIDVAEDDVGDCGDEGDAAAQSLE